MKMSIKTNYKKTQVFKTRLYNLGIYTYIENCKEIHGDTK